MSDNFEQDDFPMEQPSYEVMRDFFNQTLDVASQTKYVNWAIDYLGLDAPKLQEDGHVSVVGDIIAVYQAIMEFAKNMQPDSTQEEDDIPSETESTGE